MCIKIQQTTVAVTRVNILKDITSKISGDITMSPFINIGRTCPPCPTEIEAPDVSVAICTVKVV